MGSGLSVGVEVREMASRLSVWVRVDWRKMKSGLSVGVEFRVRVDCREMESGLGIGLELMEMESVLGIMLE